MSCITPADIQQVVLILFGLIGAGWVVIRLALLVVSRNA